MFLVVLLVFASHTNAQVPGLNFGPMWMLQRTSSYLVEYSTVLKVPKAPDNNRGLIVI